MRAVTAVLLVIFLCVGVSAWAMVPPGGAEAPAPVPPREVLVHLRPGVDGARVHAAVGGTRVRAVARLGVDVVSLPPGLAVAQAVQRYRQQPGVAWAEPNCYAQAAAIPDDPMFPLQWGPARVHAPAAWDLDTGGPSPVIAVVDTGIDPTHPDLAAKVLPGWNFVAGNANVWDDCGHGTHVAGIAAAVSDNGLGVAGLAWGNPILPVKVLDATGRGTYDAIANGIVYAADRGAAVINLSLGGPSDAQTLQAACEYAAGKGCVIVAAAGNQASTSPFYPAAYPTVISVGASDESDLRAAFSSYGPRLSVMAPGQDILSTMPLTPVALNADYGLATEYDTLSGTSMASPHVAGLAALLLSVRPGLGPTGVRSVLERTALDLGDLGWDQVTGYGRIQADAAVAEALSPAPPDTVRPTVSILAPAAGATISGQVPVSISAGDNVAVARVDYLVDGALRKTGGTQWAWPTGVDTNGTHTLAVNVRDYAGNATAASLPVNVANQPVTDTFSGTLRVAYVNHPFTTGQEGRVKATLSWSGGATMQLVIMHANGATAVETPPTKSRSCSLETVLPAGQYVARVYLLSSKASYRLTITHL